MTAEALGHARADVQDPEAKDKAPEIARFARLHAIEEVLCRFLAHPFEAGDLFKRQLVKIGHIPDQAARDELFHQNLAAALDIHGAARAPMFKPPANLGGTIEIG